MPYRFIAAGLLCLSIVACSGHGTATDVPANRDISIGPNVQISKQNANRFHGEVLMGADPVDPRHLIACSAIWPMPLTSGIGAHDATYVSFDGGQSWKETYEDRVGKYALDAVCSIGFDGNAYTGGAAATHGGNDFIVHSTDGGRHWEKPLLLPWGDRDFLTIDTSHSRYRGRVYDEALNATKTSANIGDVYSADGGRTYSKSVIVARNSPITSKTAKVGLYSGPNVVLSNGHVVVITYEWPDSSQPNKIEAFTSTDGGNSFQKAGIVASRTGSPLLNKEVGITILPTLAADTSGGAFNNRLYVVWQDQANGPQSSVMLATSDDEGKTWSAPFEVDDAPAYPVRQYPIVFAPEVAVNNKGIVAVTWFDGRSMGDGMGGRLRLAISNDGGETFSSSVPIADGAASLAPDNAPITFGGLLAYGGMFMLGTDTRYHIFAGDTQALAADAAGRFHPVWIDNRTGVSQMWTDSITVHESAIRHGNPSLSSLHDVSASLGFLASNAKYDPGTHTISADVSVQNTSKTDVASPIFLRITRLDSVLGPVHLATSDNGISGPGGIIKFQARSATLAPGEHTASRHVEFAVSAQRNVTAGDVNGAMLPYIKLNYHAYAGSGHSGARGGHQSEPETKQ